MQPAVFFFFGRAISHSCNVHGHYIPSHKTEIVSQSVLVQFSGATTTFFMLATKVHCTYLLAEC